MKVQVSGFLHFISTLSALSLVQKSLAEKQDICDACCDGLWGSSCYLTFNTDPSYTCTKCDEILQYCRPPRCGDFCTSDADCFGSYFNDSCTICDHKKAVTPGDTPRGKCVQPICSIRCDTGAFSCSGAADTCTICNPDNNLCKQPKCGDNCTVDQECKGAGSCTKCGELGDEPLETLYFRLLWMICSSLLDYYFVFGQSKEKNNCAKPKCGTACTPFNDDACAGADTCKICGRKSCCLHIKLSFYILC